MKKLVVDASGAIKWFVPEIHSEAASRLLDLEIVLCAPDVALAVAQECALVTADRKFYSILEASSLADHVEWIEAERV